MSKLSLFLLFLFLIFSKIDKTFAADNDVTSSSEDKITVADHGDTITVFSGFTLGNLTQQQKADINEKN